MAAYQKRCNDYGKKNEKGFTKKSLKKDFYKKNDKKRQEKKAGKEGFCQG